MQIIFKSCLRCTLGQGFSVFRFTDPSEPQHRAFNQHHCEHVTLKAFNDSVYRVIHLASKCMAAINGPAHQQHICSVKTSVCCSLQRAFANSLNSTWPQTSTRPQMSNLTTTTLLFYMIINFPIWFVSFFFYSTMTHIARTFTESGINADQITMVKPQIWSWHRGNGSYDDIRWIIKDADRVTTPEMSESCRCS